MSAIRQPRRFLPQDGDPRNWTPRHGNPFSMIELIVQTIIKVVAYPLVYASILGALVAVVAVCGWGQ